MRRHVFYYEPLPTPFAQAAEALAHDPASWLPAPATPLGVGVTGNGTADRATEEAWEVDLCAHGALPSPIAQRRAIVRVGPVPEHFAETGLDAPLGSELLRPLRWEAAVAEDLFPVLTADLELAPLHGEGCQLSLMGSYRPPLSVVGEATDRVLGHRVAEATVRRFVLDVVRRLTHAEAAVRH